MRRKALTYDARARSIRSTLLSGTAWASEPGYRVMAPPALESLPPRDSALPLFLGQVSFASRLLDLLSGGLDRVRCQVGLRAKGGELGFVLANARVQRLTIE